MSWTGPNLGTAARVHHARARRASCTHLVLQLILAQNVNGTREKLRPVGAAFTGQGFQKGRAAQMEEDVHKVSQQVARAEAVFFLVVHLGARRAGARGSPAWLWGGGVRPNRTGSMEAPSRALPLGATLDAYLELGALGPDQLSEVVHQHAGEAVNDLGAQEWFVDLLGHVPELPPGPQPTARYCAEPPVSASAAPLWLPRIRLDGPC